MAAEWDRSGQRETGPIGVNALIWIYERNILATIILLILSSLNNENNCDVKTKSRLIQSV